MRVHVAGLDPGGIKARKVTKCSVKCGVWGVTLSLKCANDWTITHLPSGMRVSVYATDRTLSRAEAEDILADMVFLLGADFADDLTFWQDLQDDPVMKKRGQEAVDAISAALAPGGVRWWDP